MTRDDLWVVLGFLFVMLLGGCGFPRNGDGAVTFIHVVDGAEMTEAEALAGCEMWAPLGVECETWPVPADGVIRVATFNDPGSGLWGQWNGDTVLVNVAWPEMVPSNIAHELGHSFGLPESADWRDLMGQGLELTEADVAAFRVVRQ